MTDNNNRKALSEDELADVDGGFFEFEKQKEITCLEDLEGRLCQICGEEFNLSRALERRPWEYLEFLYKQGKMFCPQCNMESKLEDFISHR